MHVKSEEWHSYKLAPTSTVSLKPNGVTIFSFISSPHSANWSHSFSSILQSPHSPSPQANLHVNSFSLHNPYTPFPAFISSTRAFFSLALS
ncbi:MAG: hypothetical protein BYD32DRAFT_422851 [Podila humilis]|nr:MAG: hypothetical protein BYD32DRAFT_422851 [Podila humilis]